jgi:two-component system phosphate regulon sensor histidine kinase PhoR
VGAKKFLWQVYPTYLLITLIALLAIGWYASSSLKDFYYTELSFVLKSRARLILHQIPEYLKNHTSDELDSLCKTLGEITLTRISFIDTTGRVIGDSERDPHKLGNQAYQPEVFEALKGRIGVSLRYSDIFREMVMHTAEPLIKDQKIVLIVRTAMPVTSIDRALKSIHIKISLGGLFIAFIAAIVGLLISHRFTRPLEEITEGAKRFAQGDLSYRLNVDHSEELESLADAMNQMASQLNERIQNLAQQSNEQAALLSSMVEGVLAVNNEEKIIILNEAAATLFNVPYPCRGGPQLQQVIRNETLHEFVKRVLTSRGVLEEDMIIADEKERYLRVHGTVLRSHKGDDMGALIVINDMTGLKILENIRRDFVANVSHELRTPITSIKGFVETLRDGALDDRDNTERFLTIISKQANRLEAIINDLLTLSRIERDTDREENLFEVGKLFTVLNAAIADCEIKIKEKNISVVLNCPEDIRIRMNSHLLEQAVVNLLDNAINYSKPEGLVEVEGREMDDEVIVSVRDFGCGIAKEHLPRLFERFYRVDRARSRKLGGTGLGLAIVKHIARVHGGRVSVDSIPDRGSIFFIHLSQKKKKYNISTG